MTRRGLLLLIVGSALLLAVGALVVPAGGPAATSAGPGGTLALRRFLASSGLDVRDATVPPAPPGTFVVLEDARDAGEARALLRWARRGGRLVVADPRSEVSALLHVRPETLSGPLFGDASLAPGCVAPEAAGVRAIRVDSRDAALAGGPAASVACFPDAAGSYELSVRTGNGTVVLLGGFSFMVNERLGRDDAGTFALGLFRSGGPVVFGPPAPPGAGRPATLWASLPAGARAALVGLGIALVAFALVRGRRLGRPVVEEPIVPIPASELVRASAGLYRNARAIAFCGELLRRGFAERVGPRLGLDRQTTPDALAASLARTTGRPEADVRDVLVGTGPRTDAELIALGVRLEELAAGLGGPVPVRAWPLDEPAWARGHEPASGPGGDAAR